MASSRSVQGMATIRGRARDGAPSNGESGLVSPTLRAQDRGPVEENSPLLGPSAIGSDRGSERTLADAGEAQDGDEPNQTVGRTRALLIILSLWGLIFLQACNVSIIAVTQSIIADELDAFTEASWFTSAYLIAMSSCAPLVGRLATIFSPRNCMLVSAVLFSLGGLVTSFARALPVFLLGRAISGVGGAGIMTITFVLVLELSGRKRRGLFVGLTNTGFTSGVALGAVLAGALVGTTGWRFLFWIQSPLALLAGVGVAFSIPNSLTSGSKDSGEKSMWSKVIRIDYIGAITLTLTIVLFLYGLSAPKIQWLSIILSFIIFPCFLYIEICFASDPIIPVAVLKSRGALLSCFAQLGIMMSRWMVLFYTPVYALSVRGWSPASAGSILVPTNMGFAAGSVLAGAFHIRRAGSFWSACIICYSLFAATLIILAFLSNAATPAWAYLLATFSNGLFVGAALNYTLAHALHLTPPDTHYIVTSLVNTFRGFAGSFGSAIGGGLFIRVLKAGLETGFAQHGLTGKKELVRRLLGSPVLVQGLEGTDKTVAVDAYVKTFKTLFLAGCALSCAMVLVQASTGWKKGRVTGEESEEVGIVRGEVEGPDAEDV